MSITWQTNPPYQNWKVYSKSLKNYVTDIIIKPENKLTKPFADWLSENLSTLSRDRYRRTENRIVAVNLLPIFMATPDLWRTIQFIGQINITDKITFEHYLDEWKRKIPENLLSHFDNIIALLIGNQINQN